MEFLRVVDLALRTNFHFIVRTRERDDQSFVKPATKEFTVKLGDIDAALVPQFGSELLDVQTCIVGNAFDWMFSLKDGIED